MHSSILAFFSISYLGVVSTAYTDPWAPYDGSAHKSKEAGSCSCGFLMTITLKPWESNFLLRGPLSEEEKMLPPTLLKHKKAYEHWFLHDHDFSNKEPEW